MSITPPINFQPYPWQVEAACRLQQHSIACAAEPGAGKTAAALLGAAAISAHRILVIAPAGAVARQWVTVSAQWGADARLCGGPREGGDKLVDAVKTHLGAPHGARVAVVPWSRLSRKADGVALAAGDIDYDLLVIDESHKAQRCEHVRCGETLWGKRAKRQGQWSRTQGLWRSVRRCILLTGSPTTSDPKKLRAQFLGVGMHLTRRDMGTQFAYEARWWNGRKEYSYAARRELWTCDTTPAPGHDALVRQAILRVSPEDLARQLPPHRREVLDQIAPGREPAMSREATAVLSEWADRLRDGNGADLPALAELADIRRASTKLRAPGISEWAAEWAEETEPGRLLLIWVCYQDSAAEIAHACGQALLDSDARVCALHGGMGDRARADILDEARAGRIRVLVATHASTGTGVDGLQHVADTALIAEAPWTPGEIAQSEGRLVRTGQTRPVRTCWLSGGIEGTIAEGVLAKSRAIEGVMQHADVARAIEDAPVELPEPITIAPEVEEPAEDTTPDPGSCTWTWTKDRRAGDWVLSCSGSTGDPDAWIGVEVQVRRRDGSTQTRILTDRRACKRDGTWSMWGCRETAADEAKRRKSYLVRRINARMKDDVFKDDPSPAPLAQADAAQAACLRLTADDLDRATKRNCAGWRQGDHTVGSYFAQYPAEEWTVGMLEAARRLLRPYRRTQIADLWPTITQTAEGAAS